MFKIAFRPEAASTFADDVDRLYFTLVALTVFFTTLVFGLLLLMTLRYRRGRRVDRSRPIEENRFLELSWTIGPLLIGLAVFVWAAKLFAQPFTPPKNAKEVFIIGKQWMWHLQHTNGIRENNELHVPIGQPVKLTMISQDVIHAFYVPEFRLQRQVFPGQYTSFWFTPTKTGRYHMYCNMYCGMQHAEMGGWVYVMSVPDYQRWLASGGAQPVAVGGVTSKTGGITMEQAGGSLFNQYGCANCHSAEAVAGGRGPSLIGIYGKKRELADGRTVLADDGYLRNVVYYPGEYPLKGWPQGMPSYKGNLTEEQVLQINAYIKELGNVAARNASLVGAKTSPPGPTGINGGGRGTTNGVGGATSGAAGMPGAYGGSSVDGGSVNQNAPNANTDNIQWRYMYGEEYQSR